MKIIGCDFHPSYQHIAMLDEETGELTEGRLLHAGGEAQRFYASLSGPVRVAAGGSGAVGGAARSGDARALPAAGGTQIAGAGESGGGAPTGHQVVLDAAHGQRLRAAVLSWNACGAARVILWSKAKTGRLSEHPASQNSLGVCMS